MEPANLTAKVPKKRKITSSNFEKDDEKKKHFREPFILTVNVNIYFNCKKKTFFLYYLITDNLLILILFPL